MELEDVKVRMPAVVIGRLSAVGDFERAHLTEVAHFCKNFAHGLVTQEGLQRLALLDQEVGQNVAALVRCRQREQ